MTSSTSHAWSFLPSNKGKQLQTISFIYSRCDPLSVSNGLQIFHSWTPNLIIYYQSAQTHGGTTQESCMSQKTIFTSLNSININVSTNVYTVTLVFPMSTQKILNILCEARQNTRSHMSPNHVFIMQSSDPLPYTSYMEFEYAKHEWLEYNGLAKNKIALYHSDMTWTMLTWVLAEWASHNMHENTAWASTHKNGMM